MTSFDPCSNLVKGGNSVFLILGIKNQDSEVVVGHTSGKLRLALGQVFVHKVVGVSLFHMIFL